MAAPTSAEELEMDLGDCAMAGLLVNTEVEMTSEGGMSDSLTNGQFGVVNTFFSTLDEVVLEGGSADLDNTFHSLDTMNTDNQFASMSTGIDSVPQLFAPEGASTAGAKSALANDANAEEPFCFSPSAFIFGLDADNHSVKTESPDSNDGYGTSPSVRAPSSGVDEPSSGIEDSCNTIDFGTVDSSVVFDLDTERMPTFSPKLQAKSVPHPIPAVPNMVLPQSRAFNFTSDAVANNSPLVNRSNIVGATCNYSPTTQFAWQQKSAVTSL